MKRIEAIIHPDRVAALCAVLGDAGYPDATVSLVEESGGQAGWTRHLRASTHRENGREQSRLDVVVSDDDAPEIINVIRAFALSGDAGCGDILMQDIAEVVARGALDVVVR